MKKLLLIILLAVLSSLVVHAQNFASTHVLDPYNPEYEPGEVVIKFKDDVDVNILKSANGIVATGLSGLDKILKESQAEKLVKIFPHKNRLKSAKMVTINGEKKEIPQLFNFYKLKVAKSTDVNELVNELQSEPEVEIAEPNYYVYSQGEFSNSPFIENSKAGKKRNSSHSKSKTVETLNDPLYDDQWYLQAVNAPQAWETTKGDSNQVIAILDTGVDWLHPDLDDNIWVNHAEINGIEGVDDDGNGFVDDYRGWDFVNNDNDPKDDNSHGTHVAGIAAAEQNNGIGITGVAPEARIMPVKLLQSSGRGNSSDLAAAIDYAAENGATIINMSLGSYAESLVVKAALENSYAGTGDGTGSMLVAAAGNDHRRSSIPNPCRTYPLAPMFPASYQWVLGVMAGDAGPCNGFSNWDFDGPVGWSNNNYEVKAPGTSINSTIPGGNYRSYNGTSMASPIVAGTVALMRQNEPEQSGEQIFARIIQSSGNYINTDSCLKTELQPDLYFVEYTIVDTLQGCDNDGVADAGETIELVVTVKNAGGQADSVWASLGFGEFEDPTVAEIIDSTSLIGSMSAYSTMKGEMDPIRIEIEDEVSNNRDIKLEFEYGCEGLDITKEVQIITVENGIEFPISNTGHTFLYPDKYYIITQHTSFDSLTILPGTHVRINDGVNIQITSYLEAIGKRDSFITFTAGQNNSWGSLIGYWEVPTEFNIEYCLFEGAGGNGSAVIHNLNQNSITKVSNSIFKNNNNIRSFGLYNSSDEGSLSIEKNIFTENNNCYGVGVNNKQLFKYNILSNNSVHGYVLSANKENEPYYLEKNVVFDNDTYSGSLYGLKDNTIFPPNYFGSVDSIYIASMIYDFKEQGHGFIVSGDSALVAPPAECHGVVWKIDINNTLTNKYDNSFNSETGLGIIGDETLKFDVYFNRPMDTTYTPLLTFGVREPYTQHIVADNGSWSADSTIYSAYYTVTAKTGDGIQRVRVAGARDNERFEIPIEDSRFEFVIQAAGAASLAFQATPGIGKVDLEWPASNTDDALGYNIYRCYNLTDSTRSDTVLISTELIIDTVFVDTDVIPDTTYQYLYKTVGTDMQETDFSKAVAATPFSAANGDANGDFSVNVADIITIVNYLLGNNPQPFLMDAADVNYDGDINVLDIVSVVNIIMAPSANGDEMTAMAAGNAEISIENDTVYVNTTSELAGIQFTLADITKEDEVKVLKALSNFEVIRVMQNDKLMILAYSLSGQTIQAGKVPLLQLANSESWIFEAVFSNTNGTAVDFTLSNSATVAPTIKLNAGFELGQNYPNPFTSETIIPFNLEMEVDEVILSIYDVMGREVKVWKLIDLAKGEHQVEWQSKQ
ncbi:MAG: S8 family serine peptidase, partial [Prolixibacteraceae bacterium]|nr:S8 family serine peptidase [Prolixibacteraceae bacterium]